MQQGISCPQCGAPVVGNQQFCGICGTKLSGLMHQQPASCPQCGTPIVPGQPFCAACGSRLTADSQPAPAQQQSKGTPPPRTTVRTVSVAPPQMQQAAQMGQVPAAGATRIKPSSPPKAPKLPVQHKYGLLRLGSMIFLILGWLVLVGGILASVGTAVFVIIGGQMAPAWGGSALSSGTAIIIALVGLIVSFIYGIGLMAIGQLCSAVADMAQKI
jgi:uncharacterized Zn finger protein (UPF0148 family)